MPSPTENAEDHLIPLSGGDWSLWRCMALRGTGLPSAWMDGLAAPGLADHLEACLDAEVRIRAARSAAYDAVGSAAAGADPALAERLRRTRNALSRRGVAPEASDCAPVDEAIERLRDAIAACRARMETLPEAVAAARRTVSDFIDRIGAEPRLLEALTWQNRRVLKTMRLPSRDLKSGTAWKRRADDQTVASYLQRYCTKNDTIGFFGPVGWARLGSTGPTVAVEPGPALVEHRATRIEQWAVDALAEALIRDQAIRAALLPKLAPRRHGFVALGDGAAMSALGDRVPLAPRELALLAACDGTRSAEALATAFAAGEARDGDDLLDSSGLPDDADRYADTVAVLAQLERWRDAQLIAWTLEVPLGWQPEATLRRRLALIGDLPTRRRALAVLDEFESAVARVGRCAGDATALETAIDALEATFTRLTGAEPHRNAGAMYAARSVVFEDCRRDLHFALGPGFNEAVGPALSLLLQSARWLTHDVAIRFRDAFAAAHADLSNRQGRAVVPFLGLWFRIQRLLFGAKDRPVEAAIALLQQRWAEILDLPPDARRVERSSTALAPRVAQAFAAPGPGWREARHHCPDLMIAATSVEAIARGDFVAVLGELHLAILAIGDGTFAPQHPEPAELREALRRDLGGARVAFVASKQWPKTTLRSAPMLAQPDDLALETGFDPSALPRDRTLRAADLDVVPRGERLIVRSRDGCFERELVDFVAIQLSYVMMQSFRLLAAAAHAPRVTIDRLVVARETWCVPAATLDFARERDAASRLLGAPLGARSACPVAFMRRRRPRSSPSSSTWTVRCRSTCCRGSPAASSPAAPRPARRTWADRTTRSNCFGSVKCCRRWRTPGCRAYPARPTPANCGSSRAIPPPVRRRRNPASSGSGRSAA